MIDTEQWKSDANCAICRRSSYCSHECTQSKRVRQKKIMDMVREKLMEKTQELQASTTVEGE